MRIQRARILVLIAIAMLLAGCTSARSSYRPIAAAEPPLDALGGDPTLIAEVPAARPVTIVDRHPLLYKPREYYENSGDNKLTKTAAAALIGVPAGIIGEFRQIIVGQPAPRY